MSSIIQPTEDRILVQRIESDSKTSMGIIIPDTAKEKPMEGIVIAVGPGRRIDGINCGTKESCCIAPVSLCIGQKILFAKWSGTEIEQQGFKFILMKESDVLAILVDDKKDALDYIKRYNDCCCDAN